MNPVIKKLYAALEGKGLDGLILSLPSNISYLCGFKSRDSYLLVSKKPSIYFTDSRYTEEAGRFLKGCALKRINGSVFKAIADAVNGFNLERVGFEERHMPFAEYKKIQGYLSRKAKILPAHGLVEDLRQVKASDELKKMRKAIRITEKAFEFIRRFISPGRKEIEVAAELERFIRCNGATASAFDIIVACGPNSSLPHHMTSERKIGNNDAVLIDLGVEYSGYKSDLTRIFFLGKISPLVRKIYGIVRSAQQKAITRIRPHIEACEVDAEARKYISKEGYGAFFGHSLGHGVGLDVHESPGISAKEKAELEPGMVFTVEPAIYLPAKFGVRIEDMVLVTSKGCEVLSGSLNK
jgi:Xaa-Pro aminopeptidase